MTLLIIYAAVTFAGILYMGALEMTHSTVEF